MINDETMKTYYDHITDVQATVSMNGGAVYSRPWAFFTDVDFYTEVDGLVISGKASDHIIHNLNVIPPWLLAMNGLSIHLKLSKIVSRIPDHVLCEDEIANKLSRRRNLMIQTCGPFIFEDGLRGWDREVIADVAKLAGIKNPNITHEEVNGRRIIKWDDDHDPLIEANWIFLNCVEIAIEELGSGEVGLRNQLNVKIRDTSYSLWREEEAIEIDNYFF